MNRLAGQSDIDAVRDATDLVRLIGEHIALRPKGREHVGLCPFHDDRTPSFAVVTHKGNAFYKCHACGAGGDAFDFVMNYHKLDFGEALRFLAERAGITLRPRHARSETNEGGGVKKTDLRKANAFAATFFRRVLNDPVAGKHAREAIAARGISDAMVEAFAIGASPDDWEGLCSRIRRQNLDFAVFAAAGLVKARKEGDGYYDAFRNRLIFPICDELGIPIAFGARKINPEDEPKYLNSAESQVFSKSKTLFGLHCAKRAIIESRQAIVTEGYTDVIACHQAGICNVVGTLGTALTRDHAKTLARLCDTVVLVFDGDEAGQRAADRGLEVFFAEPVDVKICVLPDELDPDELLKQPDGRERFSQAVSSAADALAYKVERFRSQLAGATGLSARQKRLEEFLNELAQLGFTAMQGVRKQLVLVQLADMLGVSVGAIEASLPAARRSGAGAAVQPTATAPLAVAASDSLEASELAFSDSPGASISVARRRAERDVLAILIYQPELHNQSAPAIDHQLAPISQIISCEVFADPLARLIAEAVIPWLRRGELFTVQQLLSRLEHPEARKLASSLYFEGQRLCENHPAGPAECMRAAIAALHAHLSLHEYHQTLESFRRCRDAPDQALLAAQSIIQLRRRHAHIPSAIGRGIRS